MSTLSPSASVTELVGRVMNLGIPDQPSAERALRAVLVILGQRFTDDEASALASQLPSDLAAVVGTSGYDADFDEAEFYERVRQREGTSPGVGREHADVVLRALGEILSPELKVRLVRALPDGLGRRLAPTPYGEPPPHREARHAHGISTLAHGRPGSRHPISESAPPGGHSHSVARSDDPHGDSKLSSGRPTQDQLRETLATGRPPRPARPVSETTDE